MHHSNWQSPKERMLLVMLLVLLLLLREGKLLNFLVKREVLDGMREG
jgi:hypothetical protein